ncbi:hypothetical protein ACFFGH_33140 [Lysobacter korlensis]|uniref:Uncharacterized protein n=1 Tax=Lysobacter korlensis TaxID=553636 RepID=A0ABV6S0E6_9GAMM
MSELVNPFWLAILGATAAWSALFSLSNRPHIRGWRNLGLLAGYLAGVAMFIVLPWRESLSTWAVPGVLGGVLYFAYELVSYLHTTPREPNARPRPAALVHGLFLWPVMLPEAVECLLAELGILRAQVRPVADP